MQKDKQPMKTNCKKCKELWAWLKVSNFTNTMPDHMRQFLIKDVILCEKCKRKRK